ncbi:MAG TPA: hypothetical protein VIY53_02395 [Acidobacteriaceae bacterium]
MWPRNSASPRLRYGRWHGLSPAVIAPPEDGEGNLDEILFEEIVNNQSRIAFNRNDPTATREEQEGAAEGIRQILDKMAGIIAELTRNSPGV